MSHESKQFDALEQQPEITITGNPSPEAAKAIVAMVKQLLENGMIKSAGYVWTPTPAKAHGCEVGE
jgi:hypothetical protein